MNPGKLGLFRRPLASAAARGVLPTIYALSTPKARAAIAVIRVSGSQASQVYTALTGKPPPPPRMACVSRLVSPAGVLLDEALTLFFRGPRSYTGEDLLELQVHGGVAIMTGVLNAIRDLHRPQEGVNIRYAEPGEFSRRAFVNGRSDLTQLEGVREMIDADTETQRLAALSSVQGRNKAVFGQWRQSLLNNIALLTTVIDFGDDHDIDEVAQLFDTVGASVHALRDEVAAFLHNVDRSQVLLSGIKLTLLGPPNAGKSSILNCLANKDAAIVSSIAGTTRDALEVPLDIGGYKVVVGDTAGIRDSGDVIEAEGIRRAKEKSLGSDLALVVVASDDVAPSEAFLGHLDHLKQSGTKIVGILNKEDLIVDRSETVRQVSQTLGVPPEDLFVVSCTTGSGFERLVSQLTDQFQHITTADPVSISSRARDILVNDVVYGIEQFEVWRAQDDIVLATESLKQAVVGIGLITGDAIGVEEILGVVFSSFCIGK